ncbi:MAG: GNAT family N-acetyltransferase [Chloroflexi bacterium]|nr:GNAT family N-acetyltransferase [Chloroflexota bacterium]
MTIDVQNLTVKNNEAAHRFEVALEDQIGVIEYQKAGKVYTMTHTEVPPSFAGKGIAQHLVKSALDMVQAEGAQVVPQCPYVKAYIQRHPAYQALVAPTQA